jgi:hypothetical protein
MTHEYAPPQLEHPELQEAIVTMEGVMLYRTSVDPDRLPFTQQLDETREERIAV